MKTRNSSMRLSTKEEKSMKLMVYLLMVSGSKGWKKLKRLQKSFFRSPLEGWENRPKLGAVEFKKISSEDNDFLTKEFTEEEVKVAIWQCGEDKSPGPDG